MTDSPVPNGGSVTKLEPVTDGENSFLRGVGTALYGGVGGWIAMLAVELNVDKNTVRKWANEKSRLPEGVKSDIVALLNKRMSDIGKLLDLAKHQIIHGE